MVLVLASESSLMEPPKLSVVVKPVSLVENDQWLPIGHLVLYLEYRQSRRGWQFDETETDGKKWSTRNSKPVPAVVVELVDIEEMDKLVVDKAIVVRVLDELGWRRHDFDFVQSWNHL